MCFSWIEISLCLTSSICPNGCSSHGVCADSSSGGCDCFPSFTGVDCSLRVCSSSSAWVDVPTDSLHAHAEFAECSNMVLIMIVLNFSCNNLTNIIHLTTRENVTDQPVFANVEVDLKVPRVISVSSHSFSIYISSFIQAMLPTYFSDLSCGHSHFIHSRRHKHHRHL